MRRGEYTAESLLTEWGKWAYQNRGLKLYYPSITPTERMRAKMGSGCMISEDDALAVDAAVSSLVEDSRNIHAAVAMYYVCGYTYRQIAKALGTHHRTASSWVDQGRMYVKGVLFGAPNS